MPLLGRKPIALSLELYRQVGMAVDIGTHINILCLGCDANAVYCVIIIGYYNLESNGGCKVNMVKPHKQEKRTSQIISTHTCLVLVSGFQSQRQSCNSQRHMVCVSCGLPQLSRNRIFCRECDCGMLLRLLLPTATFGRAIIKNEYMIDSELCREVAILPLNSLI